MAPTLFWIAMENNGFADLYEVLQVNPSAQLDTIHRIYRILAQRLHPDNIDSGNEESFRRLLEAYRVLGDPERRAAYDVEYQSQRKLQWRIFDQASAVSSVAAERRKRDGVLGLLYRKRVTSPHLPGMNVNEMEDLLGCPKEHLEFTLWYLKECGYIQRNDQGRHQITAKGVEAAEAVGPAAAPESVRFLLNAPGRVA